MNYWPGLRVLPGQFAPEYLVRPPRTPWSNIGRTHFHVAAERLINFSAIPTYVDEILYAAKISPFSKADKIPEDKIKVLSEAIPLVLTHAESHISQQYPDTITEKERDFLQVHRPKQKLTPGGEEILKADINKRKIYYTESQKLFE